MTNDNFDAADEALLFIDLYGIGGAERQAGILEVMQLDEGNLESAEYWRRVGALVKTVRTTPNSEGVVRGSD